MAETNNTAARRNEAALIPAVNVIEDAEGITLYADLPGVSKEKLQLQVEADVLTIEGEMAFAPSEGATSIHAEVESPKYRRAFTLSRELDAEKVTAELTHGVLKLRIPKKDHAQPRRIAITLH
jgi:HSP20 family molecular chaperone IbpA